MIYHEDNCDFTNFSEFEFISGTDLLKLTISVMLADGKIDPNEYDLIRKLSTLKHITEKEIQKNIDELKAMDNPIEYVLDNSTMNLDENILRYLIEIATSDGNLDEKEVKLLSKFGELLEVSSSKLNNMIKKAIEKHKKC